MGWSFEDLLAVVEAVPEDAVVFGRGTFEFRQPLRIGTTYEVRSTITQVEPRYGRRVGTFDAITVTHELWPCVGGPRVTTTETYIVPRPGGPSTPTPLAPSPPLIRSPHSASERHRVAFGPVRQEDIMTVMEVMGDTNPVHLDRDMALAAGYRGAVNQGPSNLAYVFTAIAGLRGDLHGLRYVDFTFHATVTEGDRPEVQLSAQGTDVLADLVVADDVRALSCRCTFG